MIKATWISFMAVVLICAGCAAVSKAANRVAPSQVDSTGQPIPATHTATPLAADTAAAIPYGSFALNALLLIWNFVERVKADKVDKGLRSTVLAIEQAGKDPATADAIAKLKVDLANAHQVAGIQPVIQDILAKV